MNFFPQKKLKPCRRGVFLPGNLRFMERALAVTTMELDSDPKAPTRSNTKAT